MLDFKGAIFDLDGTILDSTDVWLKVDMDFLDKRGLDKPLDYVEAISTMHLKEASVYTKERFNLPETPEEIVKEWTLIAEYEFSNNVLLKKGAYELLQKLKDKGVKLGIATASTELLFVPSLKKNKIDSFFESTTTTYEVKKSKLYGDVYLLAAKKLGLEPSECVVFEDVFDGIKAAKQAGFTVYAVADKSNVHAREDIKEIADKIIYDYTELL